MYVPAELSPTVFHLLTFDIVLLFQDSRIVRRQLPSRTLAARATPARRPPTPARNASRAIAAASVVSIASSFCLTIGSAAEGHAERAETHSDEQRHHQGIGGHLTADRNRRLRAPGGDRRGPEQSQHRRRGRLVVSGQPLVRAVDRQSVLDKVIRAHAEEVSVARELIHGQRCRGNLNHRTDRHIRRRSDVARRRPDELPHLLELVGVRHKREQDAQRAGAGCAQERGSAPG